MHTEVDEGTPVRRTAAAAPAGAAVRPSAAPHPAPAGSTTNTVQPDEALRVGRELLRDATVAGLQDRQEHRVDDGRRPTTAGICCFRGSVLRAPHAGRVGRVAGRLSAACGHHD